MSDPFPLSMTIRIDWSELDLFGHVNNLAFLKYVQASRVNYWDHIGLSDYYTNYRQGPLLVSTTCNYKKSLFFPGNVTVKARFSFIKNSSFGIQHRLFNDQQELVAEAEDVIVMFDFKANQKMAFPADIRLKVEQLENRSF